VVRIQLLKRLFLVTDFFHQMIFGRKLPSLMGRIGWESLNSTKAMTVQFVVFSVILYGEPVMHTLHLYIILELKYCPHSLLGKVQNN
jgi:hypothetical protein